MHKELKNYQIKKWPNELSRYFSKEEQMNNKYMKKLPAPLNIRKMHIKTTLIPSYPS
jgi:hypothetical protein